MIKRARISLEIASIAAIFGFTGIIDAWAVYAQAAFYGLVVFAFLSLLFGLFEEDGEPGFSIPRPDGVSTPPQSPASLSNARTSR
jgi:uncharacterized membrane protein YtjA (UPF0391 family)